MGVFKPIPSPSSRPKCPNHGCPLEDVSSATARKGQGTCPVSKCRFDFEIDTEQEESEWEETVDKEGNVRKTPRWKITGDD